MIVAVLIRTKIGASKAERKTLETLGLKRQNYAVLLENNKHIIGQLESVKNYITWGEINKEGLAALLKRAEISNNKKYEWKEGELDEFVNKLLEGNAKLSDKKIKNVFRLHPPIGGFKGSKKQLFNNKGELGYRGEEINKLILKMV